MARARVALAAAKQASGGHPNVVITGAGRSVVLDITDAAATFSDLAAKWEEVPRPSRQPILAKTGKQLAKVSFEAVIGLDPKVDIGPRLAALVFIAQNADRVIIGHTTPNGEPLSSAWTLTGLSHRVLRRRHGDNAITRARASIDLTQTSPMYPTQTASPTTVRAAAAPTKAVARRHIVRTGDTVWTIARDHYAGDANAWKRIAEANNLRDLRNLPVGKVLVLP